MVDMRLPQPQLEDLGPDFAQLQAVYDYDSPHRLHVKIRPVGAGTAPRWEVPEDLIPR